MRRLRDIPPVAVATAGAVVALGLYQWNLAIDGTLVQARATTNEWGWLNSELKNC